MVRGKGGEITTQQIVILVVLIASFGVILYFFASLGLGEESDKDLCHNSVVTRGSAVVPTEAMPLKCKRSYVCISKDGSCEGMYKPIVKEVDTKEDVYEVLANEMADCWWMYGEGKINYVGDDFTHNWYCSMCSQIAFDDSIKDIFTNGKIDKKELYIFMTENNRTGAGSTYSEYLYETNSVDNLMKTDKGQMNPGFMDISRQYYTLTAIQSEVSDVYWIASGVVTGAVALFFLPVSVPGAIIGGIAYGIAGTVGGFAGDFVASVVEGDSGNDYISPTLVEVGSKEFKELKCDEIVTAA